MFKRSLVVLGMTASLAACGEGVQPDQQEVVYFTALETDLPEPKPIADPGPRITSEQRSTYEPIVNGFIANHEQLFRRADIATQIERIDNIFLVLGRYHELVAMYRDDWERAGTESHVADRFAWALVRMGQRKKARDVIDELLQADPRDARHHFLDGAYSIQATERAPDDLKKAVRSWKRVLELDPGFRGYEGINAEVLESEIAKLEQQVGSSDPEAETTSAIDAAATLIERAVEVAPAEPPPEVAAEPVGEERAAVEERDEPSVVDEKRPDEERYKLAVARGQIALAQGQYAEAEIAFRKAQTIRPAGFDAEFGQLRAAWSETAARNEVAAAIRELAASDDLEPRHQLELATFLWTKMAREDLATELLEKAKSSDPSLAGRVDQQLKAMSE